MSPSVTITILLVVVLSLLGLTKSLDILNPPHTVSGVVWEDWNEDGIRQEYEPGFPYVRVSLLYESTEDLNVIIGNTEPYLGEIKEYWTKADGEYSFDCLTAGNYAVRFQPPNNRPSMFGPANAGGDDSTDSDVTIVEGNMGTTELFQAESAASTSIDCALSQTRFVNLFTMTGREAVPESPTSAVGTSYTIYDSPSSTLYYRIYHDEWKGDHVTERSAFHEGWPGVNGHRVRSLGDRSNVKTNFWIVPDSVKPHLMSGDLFFLSHASGSFTDLGRIRGNWNSHYNKQTVQTTIHLSGSRVAPEAVSSPAYGKVWFSFNINANYISYKVWLDDFGRAEVSSVAVYGPSDVSSVAPYLFELPIEGERVDISNIPDFVENFMGGRLYVLVTSSQYPDGHLRAQITMLNQVVYTSVIDLLSTTGAIGQAAFSLDTVKHHLAYYVYFEGLTGLELFTVLETQEGFEYLEGDYYKDGAYIKQGFFWETSEELEKEVLSGKTKVTVSTEFGDELTGRLTNWF